MKVKINKNIIKVTKVKDAGFKPIPPFKTMEEEANFWDTHSVVDAIDDGTFVGFHVANKTRSVTIRFSEEDIQKLRDKAFKLDIGPTDLARKWVTEKLHAAA